MIVSSVIINVSYSVTLDEHFYARRILIQQYPRGHLLVMRWSNID